MALRGDVYDIGAVSGEGAALRLRALERNGRLEESVKDFAKRLDRARGTADEMKVLGEWMTWLNGRAAKGGTGIFKIQETEP